MNATQSCCTLVLSRRSILDTLFVFKAPQMHRSRPAYATTTNGSITILWRVDGRGRLSEVSRIMWPSSSSKSHELLINGQVMLVRNVLQRSKSLFGSDSRTFAAGNKRCKWKSGKTGSFSPNQSTFGGSAYTSLQVWTCHENPDRAMRASLTGSSTFPAPSAIALFFPPQAGSIKSEMTIYPNGEPIMDHIVLTALLVCTRTDQWRSSQSTTTPEALEASLKASLRSSLPPYLPIGSSRMTPRVTSPSPRRPHTATSAYPLRTFPQAPPPYTSVDDVSLRPR